MRQDPDAVPDKLRAESCIQGWDGWFSWSVSVLVTNRFLLRKPDLPCYWPEMKQIRENIWYVTHDDLDRVDYKGPVEVKGLGTLFLDIADENYIKETTAEGYAPAFFVSRSPALNGWFVVVSRQRPA